MLHYFDLTESEPMVNGSENNGLPFQPFHRPKSNTGGSAWLLSGAILACGVALPGLCLAWQWKQTSVTEPVPLMVTIVVVDALFILTATVFLSTGGLFGRQRHTVTLNYPGPFKEQDGSYFPPAYVQPYVMTAALLFGVVTPTIVLGSLLWLHEIILGVCTLGVYLLEVAAQLISETVYVRKGVCLSSLLTWHAFPNAPTSCTYDIHVQNLSCGLKCLRCIKPTAFGNSYEAAMLWVFWMDLTTCGPCKLASWCFGCSTRAANRIKILACPVTGMCYGLSCMCHANKQGEAQTAKAVSAFLN